MCRFSFNSNNNLFYIWFNIPGCNDEEEIPAKPLTKEEKRTKEIARCFSGWNGSHLKLRELIKKSMNDPDSYDHVETKYIDNDSTLLVITTFRGKNTYGGVVKQTITAITDTKTSGYFFRSFFFFC